MTYGIVGYTALLERSFAGVIKRVKPGWATCVFCGRFIYPWEKRGYFIEISKLLVRRDISPAFERNEGYHSPHCPLRGGRR